MIDRIRDIAPGHGGYEDIELSANSDVWLECVGTSVGSFADIARIEDSGYVHGGPIVTKWGDGNGYWDTSSSGPDVVRANCDQVTVADRVVQIDMDIPHGCSRKPTAVFVRLNTNLTPAAFNAELQFFNKTTGVKIAYGAVPIAVVAGSLFEGGLLPSAMPGLWLVGGVDMVRFEIEKTGAFQWSIGDWIMIHLNCESVEAVKSYFTFEDDDPTAKTISTRLFVGDTLDLAGLTGKFRITQNGRGLRLRVHYRRSAL